jgi:hypothetical protein
MTCTIDECVRRVDGDRIRPSPNFLGVVVNNPV